jgi:hypothetical protein
LVSYDEEKVTALSSELVQGKNNHIPGIPIGEELLAGDALIPLPVTYRVLQLPHGAKNPHRFTGARSDLSILS